MTAVSDLLDEKSGADVLEAIQFLTLSHQYSLPGAEAGVQEMLRLVSSKEPGIRDAVIEAYTELYMKCASNKDKKADAIDVR